MPPETKPQPTVAEVDLVANWIARGSLFPGEIAVAKDPEIVEDPEPPVVEVSQPKQASPEALAAMRARLVHVEPVAKDSELLWIDFVAAARTIGDNEATELLEPVLDYVTDLSMSRSLISDETMKLVARMPRLTKLDLRGTNITDAGVAALAGHPTLVELVMPRTKLTDGAAQHLLRLPKLRRVYLWNSGVTIRGIAELRLGREDLVIEAGDAGEARALEVEGSLALTKPEPVRVGAAPPVNAACPVTGKPVDPAYSIVFRGRVIGFCCPKCPATFWADPAAYEAKFK
jgi:hypothetical protein